MYRGKNSDVSASLTAYKPRPIDRQSNFFTYIKGLGLAGGFPNSLQHFAWASGVPDKFGQQLLRVKM